ncbi:SGNH/GDSL hydrolase family protein [Jatrophihabitans telluris]|uniref:SGNH/GDSL hydrolase family protein n=1 Tax=Jatrophihabitans telluris TaxID=2038343 RepID=A0ABY4R0Z8_9ACTN|nr:SGNH/GDSL hydrolase family protein [Jatrophihabitans telluris]UQX89152.1 SGNH/GDSL hydrolase family protein [Jatrophihabitans telluris]
MTGTELDFDYSNLSGRPPGRFVSIAARLLPGVRTVQEEIEPYAAAWQAANRAALSESADPARPLWIALGDSMSMGVGASAYDRGFIGQLAELLAPQTPGGRGYRIVNLASSGARTDDIVERQLPALDRLISRGPQPALVTVLVGSNDLLRRRYREILPERFARMLDRVPVGTVVANLPQPREAARTVNRLIERAVGERGLILADMRSHRTASWRGKLAADHFHPNDLGYAGMAEVFADAIPPVRI